MKFKHLLTFFAVAVLLFLAACSSPLIYSSAWQGKPVTIDGKATEWKIPLDYYDDKTKLNFSISNDATNLYFCIRATEDATQKGIIRNGLQIWIDTTGGKRKVMGIQFPVIEKRDKSSGSESSKQSDMDPAAAAYGLHKQYSGSHKQMSITGFPDGINGLVDMPNMYGLNAYLNWDTNSIMIYEACIPLKTFYKATLSFADTNKVIGISLGVTVPSATAPQGNGEGKGHGGHGGGMGGGGGGMGGPASHGGDYHGNSFTTESLVASIKFRLAAPNH